MLNRELDIFGDIDSLVASMFGKDRLVKCPLANTIKKSDGWEIHVSVPGFTREDISLELKENIITVRGQAKVSEDRYVRQEFFSENFSRSFTVPASAKTEAISAKTENGFLVISIPLKEESKPVEIKVS